MATLVDHSYTDRVIVLHRAHKTAYRISYFGKIFVVYPGVFSPKYALSSRAVTEELLKHKVRGKVLDMGTGTGVQAVFAALRGARRVLAVDVNPNAIACTKANVRMHGLGRKVEVRLSDLYSSISRTEKFDLIIADLPFVSAEPRDMLERAFYSPEHRVIRDFLRQTLAYLATGGTILMTFSSLDDNDWFLRSLRKCRYDIVRRGKAIGDGQEWHVFWIRPSVTRTTTMTKRCRREHERHAVSLAHRANSH